MESEQMQSQLPLLKTAARLLLSEHVCNGKTESATVHCATMQCPTYAFGASRSHGLKDTKAVALDATASAVHVQAE